MPETVPFAIVESEGPVSVSFAEVGDDRYVSIAIGEATFFLRDRDDLDKVIDGLADASTQWRASQGRELQRDEAAVRNDAELREALQ